MSATRANRRISVCDPIFAAGVYIKAKIYENYIQQYTPIRQPTSDPTLPLYHIIIIFDTVLRQKRNIEHEKNNDFNRAAIFAI